MTPEALIDAFERRGVELSFEGKRLHFRAPKGALDDADRAALGGRRDALVAALRARARSRSSRLPLSFGQQSLWLMDSLSPGSPVNNLATAIRVDVPADPVASGAALQRLLDRHDQLRATFHVDAEGALFQNIAGAATGEPELHDAEGLADDALRAFAEAERNRPFDLERGPLIRLHLLRLGAHEHVQLLVVHHIVSDGLSMLTLMAELLTGWSEAAGGAPVEMPRPQLGYADHIAAEAALLESPRAEALWDYWREQMADAPALLPLPFDRERPAVPSFRGASVLLPLDDATVERLVALSRESGTTLFVLMLTLFGIFLARQTRVYDVVVGTSFSDRPEASYGVVGDYVNALPVRARLRTTMTVREAIAAQRQVVQDAMSSQAYPARRLIERLQPARHGGASPLFNCFFNFNQFPAHRAFSTLLTGFGDGIELGGTRMAPFRLPQQPGQFDLTLNLSWSGEALRGSLDFATDLLDRDTADRLAAELTAFLATAAGDPDETLMPRRDRARLLEDFNATVVAQDEAPFIEQFAGSAERNAHRCALLFGDECLDYATLLRRVETLSRHLRAAGAERGVVVGLLLERTPAMLTALLAIQRTGATYLPLDPGFPPQRLAFMAEDSGLSLLLTEGSRPDWLPVQATLCAMPADLDATSGPPVTDGPRRDDIAYILYTSGSTGRPNGVRISHGAMANFLGSMVREPGIAASDLFAAVTTISFDIAVLELFGPLLVGAIVDLVPREIASDGRKLAARLAETGATMLQATPTSWRLLVDADWQPAPGFRALSGGEPLPSDLAAALLSRGVSLWNLYGPTETTVHSTCARIDDADAVDVGRPIANTRIYVLDDEGEPVPIGADGAIWIGGAGVAEGYHRRPELTAERFRPDLFADDAGARMYRTGDMGRWRADGRLVHLGRADDQLKLRGFRVEPAEIEAVLAAMPGVRRAVVVAREVGGDVRLAAFIVHDPGSAPTTGELRRHVRASLPDYMVPAMFVDIADVPVTPNGKVDRRSLPNPFVGAVALGAGELPRRGLEQQLARIWEDALGTGPVRPDDNFFAIGGHSLLALKVTNAFELDTRHRIAPTTLFFHTLRQIVDLLQAADHMPAKDAAAGSRWLGLRRRAAR